MTTAAPRFATWKAVLPALGILVFMVVAVAAYCVAMDPWHNNAYDGREACIVFGGIPQGTVMETVTNPTTLWPLGFLCEHGSTVVPWQNWPATIVSYSAWFLVLLCVVLLSVALLRWRFASPRLPAMRHAIAQQFTVAARSVPVLVGLVVVLAATASAVVVALIGR